VGAQGGEIEPVLRHGPARSGAAGARFGGGLLVNVSRGIASAATTASTTADGSVDAASPGDPLERIAAAAADWAARLPVLP
jgi:hypothetical protein